MISSHFLSFPLRPALSGGVCGGIAAYFGWDPRLSESSHGGTYHYHRWRWTCCVSAVLGSSPDGTLRTSVMTQATICAFENVSEAALSSLFL